MGEKPAYARKQINQAVTDAKRLPARLFSSVSPSNTFRTSIKTRRNIWHGVNARGGCAKSINIQTYIRGAHLNIPNINRRVISHRFAAARFELSPIIHPYGVLHILQLSLYFIGTRFEFYPSRVCDEGKNITFLSGTKPYVVPVTYPGGAKGASVPHKTCNRVIKY